MKHKLSNTGGIVFVLTIVCAASAGAQTVAQGPYYATPSWDQTLACTSPAACPRFIVLANFDSEAVLDRNTGLVWERTPSDFILAWVDASSVCLRKKVGGQKGWRMPTIQELSSLIDPTALRPALPPGHPFTGTTVLGDFWSSTTFLFNPDQAWHLSFSDGQAAVRLKTNALSYNVLCVRGGQAMDSQ
jgi:hypothetical protein